MRLILTETDVALIERAVAGVEDAANEKLADIAQAVGPDDFEKVKSAVREWVRGVATFRLLVESFKEAFGPSGMGLLSRKQMQRDEVIWGFREMESTFGIEEQVVVEPLERHFEGEAEEKTAMDAWMKAVWKDAAEKGVDYPQHFIDRYEERPRIGPADRLWEPLLAFVSDYLDGLSEKVPVG